MLSLLSLLISCDEPAEPGALVTWIQLSPEEVYTHQDVEAEVETEPPLEDPGAALSFRWFVDDALVRVAGPRLDHTSYAAGQEVYVEVHNDQGQSWRSHSVAVLNSPPEPPRVRFTPADPVVGEELVCAVEGADRDGDALSYQVRWLEGRAPYIGPTRTAVVEGDTLPGEVLLQAGTWTCQATAWDGEDESQPGVARVEVRWADNTRSFGDAWLRLSGLGINRAGKVVSAGDLDGDGYPELIVGAPMVARREFHGKVHVLLGASLEPGFRSLGSDDFTVTNGNQANIGDALVFAGDVDGDGLGELMIGSRYRDNLAVLLRGERVEAGGEIAVSDLEDRVTGTTAGAEVGAAGDVDGDGLADVLVTSTWSPHGWLFLGADMVEPGAMDPALIAAATYTPPDEANGPKVAGLGDVDGDGLDDVGFGLHSLEVDGLRGAGEVHVFSGAALAGRDISPEDADLTIRAEAPGGHLGAAMAPAGSRDGVSAFLVGAPGDGGTEETSYGAAFLFAPGALDGGVIGPSDALGRVDGQRRGDHLGAALYAAGDLDGDGVEDVILGAPGFDQGPQDVGAAFVFSGAAMSGGASLDGGALAALVGEDRGGYAGTSVHGGADLDGDGVPDLLVGAPGVDAGPWPDTGRVALFSGAELAP